MFIASISEFFSFFCLVVQKIVVSLQWLEPYSHFDTCDSTLYSGLHAPFYFLVSFFVCSFNIIES